MYSKHVLRSLPLLASVLGDQHGVEIVVGGDQACTNGRTVYLPSLPLDSDSETLALVRGYIDHEAGGHLRFTNFKALRRAKLTPLEKHIWNAIEDWRVENALCELYPGCRGNLDYLIRRFFLEEHEGPADSPENAVLNYVLLTVRSWDVPELADALAEERQMVDQAFPGLADEMAAVLSKVHAACPDTETALSYAKELANCITSWRLQKPDGAGQTGSEDGQTGNGEGDRSGAARSQAQGEAQDSEQGSAESQGQYLAQDSQGQNGAQPGKAGVEDNTEAPCPTSKTETGQDQAPAENSPAPDRHVTREQHGQSRMPRDRVRIADKDIPTAFGEKMAKIIEQAGQDVPSDSLMQIARTKHCTHDPLDDTTLEEVFAATSFLRNRLEGLMQAQSLQRTGRGRRGRLDTSALYRLATNDPRVFRSNVPTVKTDTAIHVLCDASGSMMGEQLELARKACFALAWSLKRTHGVNPAVSAFPAVGSACDVAPVLEHGQPMHTNFGIKASGMTPLGEALFWVMQRLYAQPEARKVMFLLTDGYPDNPESAQAAIEEARKLGMEVYGIGILYDQIQNILPGRSEVILKLVDLPSAMFRLMQKALVERSQP